MAEDLRDAEHRERVNVIGRGRELAALAGLCERTRPGPRAVVMQGEPGIGKTTLWEAAVEAARGQCVWVGRSRASGAEALLSFVALGDLFEGVGAAQFGTLPPPQQRALELALLRAEVEDEVPDPRAVAVGVLGLLREMARGGTALVAIDDAQWLDHPSASALAFAARRVTADVRFLVSLRSGTESPLVDALKRVPVERVRVGPLGYAEIRCLLVERLGPAFSGRLLRRIHETAGGNPLAALELGHALAETGQEGAAQGLLPLPKSVDELLGIRVTGLPASARRALLAVGLSGDLRVPQLETVVGRVGIEQAVDAGVLEVDGERVRPAHPLFAAAAGTHSRPSDRRRMHLLLSRAVAGDELRARHLALATTEANGDLAETVAGAARSAAGRGAAEAAAELAEHALRLTPRDEPSRGERVLALAQYLLVAGEPQRLSDLLGCELETLPPGTLRARAHLLLAEGQDVQTGWDHDAELGRALAECDADPGLRSIVIAHQVISAALVHVAGIAAADAHAVEALSDARATGGDAERHVLHALGWTRILRGRDIADLAGQFDATPKAPWPLYLSLDRQEAIRLMWRGEVSAARTMLERLSTAADERGEAMSSAILRLQLCELSLRAGPLSDADSFLGEWEQSTDLTIVSNVAYDRCSALAAASRGFADAAERSATHAITQSEAVGLHWDRLEAMRARGLAAIAARRPAQAAVSLNAVWAHTQREEIDDPGAFPVAPDLVETLVETGRIDEARSVTERLQQLAENLDHPWARVSAGRCRALVLGEDPAMSSTVEHLLADAASDYGQMGLLFDRARSLLILGRTLRRLRKWAAARAALEQAATAFADLDSPGWQALANAEIGRISARRPRADGALTPSEQRVALLAADGHTNKEIGQILVISVHTVETHLSHAYEKLGVRSRGQLARKLAADR